MVIYQFKTSKIKVPTTVVSHIQCGFGLKCWKSLLERRFIMTANQIAYARYLEDARTHRVQEAETERSNRAREAEQSRGNTLNYEASLYSTRAAMRNADVQAQTQRDVAAINSAAQLQVASINAATTRRGQDIQQFTTMRGQEFTRETEMAKLGETARSNRQKETVSGLQTGSNMVLNAVGTGLAVAKAIALLV